MKKKFLKYVTTLAIFVMGILIGCGKVQDEPDVNPLDQSINGIESENGNLLANDVEHSSSTGEEDGEKQSAFDGDYEELQFEEELELLYANQFHVKSSKEGYRLIQIEGIGDYLLIPENANVPKSIPRDVTVLQQPLAHAYLAATSAMDYICEIDAMENIRLSGVKQDGWYISEAITAMEEKKLIYAGKYNMPDYELILSEGCDVAIESTMILHSPEVKEQLEKLGIPVLVEHSSYEEHPLGRVEWIKLYGVLFDQEEKADGAFKEQLQKLDNLVINEGESDSQTTIAFFYITSNGTVSVRKASDYISKTIAMAGGEYVFADMEEDGNALSTMNMQMEAFYAGAKDADILIYNSSIDNEVYTIDELLQKSELLSDFKAVQNGNVFCTGKNLFQESLGIVDLLVDMNQIVNNPEINENNLQYLHRLK